MDVTILPNAADAFIDEEKLIGYSLNFEHPTGKHKAYVFQKRLNITSADIDWLIEQIFVNILLNEAKLVSTIRHGTLWQVDFSIEKEKNTAIIRTGWIIRLEENFPRLTTCYIL